MGFFLGGGGRWGGCLKFCILRVLGVVFFLKIILMVPSLHIPLGVKYLFTSLFWPLHLGGLSRHVRSVHLHVNSFPMLARMFFLCKCPPLLCFSLLLFLLLLGVGFKRSLSPFWGYLNLTSCTFVCFTKSLESSKMRSSRLFIYSLIKLLKT